MNSGPRWLNWGQEAAALAVVIAAMVASVAHAQENRITVRRADSIDPVLFPALAPSQFVSGYTVTQNSVSVSAAVNDFSTSGLVDGATGVQPGFIISGPAPTVDVRLDIEATGVSSLFVRGPQNEDYFSSTPVYGCWAIGNKCLATRSINLTLPTEKRISIVLFVRTCTYNGLLALPGGQQVEAGCGDFIGNPGAGNIPASKLRVTIQGDPCRINVPSYKQTDPAWGDDTYDHLARFAPATKTKIRAKGCVLTSLAMVMSYYGYLINPRQLNNLLQNTYNDTNANGILDPTEKSWGYSNGLTLTQTGNLDLSVVSGLTAGGLVFKGRSGSREDLEGDLCAQRPVILRVKNNEHSVVATGIVPAAAGSAKTYSLNDPGYTSRDRLDAAAYGNTWNYLSRIGPPGTGMLSIKMEAGVEALVRAPDGRRVGKYNGVVFLEIAGSSVEEEKLADLDEPFLGTPVLTIQVPKPPQGTYTLFYKTSVPLQSSIEIERFDLDDRPQSPLEVPLTAAPGVESSTTFLYSSLAGDLNSDGAVDALDLAVIEASLGKVLGAPGFNPIADTNRDGVVDARDRSLLSPVPAAGAVTPNSGEASARTFSFSFRDGQGVSDLSVINILINHSIDGRNACYLAYIVTTKTLVLVNDGGDAGGPFAGAMALPSTGSIANSQCSISGIGSNVSTYGNMITLTLDISFSPTFGGRRILYTAARDQSANNSGWQANGIWTVPGGPVFGNGTTVTAISPARFAGQAMLLTSTFADTAGYRDLNVINLLINSALDGRSACYLAYVVSTGQLLLVNDSGDAGGPFAGSAILPGNGSVSNGQCRIDGASSSVTTGGNSITLQLGITFGDGFRGSRVVYAAARDSAGNNTGWQAAGTIGME